MLACQEYTKAIDIWVGWQCLSVCLSVYLSVRLSVSVVRQRAGCVSTSHQAN